MENKRYFKIAGLFVLVMGLNIQEIRAGEEVGLKLLLKPNQKYGMRMMTKTNYSQTSEGQVSKGVEEKTVEFFFDVLEVSSQGDILMKVTFGKLKIKKKSSMDTTDFDSTKPNAGQYNRHTTPIYSALIGGSFKVKVASNGNILKLEAIDDMIGKTAEKVIAAEDKKMDKKAIRKENRKYGGREKRKEKRKKLIEVMFLHEKNIRPMMQSFIPILPSGPVKAGDSWKSRTDIEFLQGTMIKLKNTLKEGEKGKVIIDSVYKRTLDDRPIRDRSYPGRMFTKIDYSGTARIDKSSGWIIHKEVKTSFSAKDRNQGITTSISANIVKIIEPVESATSR